VARRPYKEVYKLMTQNFPKGSRRNHLNKPPDYGIVMNLPKGSRRTNVSVGLLSSIKLYKSQNNTFLTLLTLLTLENKIRGVVIFISL
jgi:hypothetical protein